jgi:hypothetical protein
MRPAEIAAKLARECNVSYVEGVRMVRGPLNHTEILDPPTMREAREIANRYAFSADEIYIAWESERDKLRVAGGK